MGKVLVRGFATLFAVLLCAIRGHLDDIPFIVGFLLIWPAVYLCYEGASRLAD